VSGIVWNRDKTVQCFVTYKDSVDLIYVMCDEPKVKTVVNIWIMVVTESPLILPHTGFYCGLCGR